MEDKEDTVGFQDARKQRIKEVLEKFNARRALPLADKVKLTQERIVEWFEAWDGQVYVSFSGGVDSTVLLHLAREIYPQIRGLFMDTGLEWPEIRAFVKQFQNIDWVAPEKPFHRVIKEHGYPVVSKEVAQKISKTRVAIRDGRQDRVQAYLYGNKNGNDALSRCWWYLIDAPFKISDKCCDILKKRPARKYCKQTGRKPILGIMAGESRRRLTNYIKADGCNVFDSKEPRSKPLSIWTKEDIWEYIKVKGLDYSEIYRHGIGRTGCMFCGFGAHFESIENGRFEIMRKLHPKIYKYCMDTLGMREVLETFCGGKQMYFDFDRSAGNICRPRFL